MSDPIGQGTTPGTPTFSSPEGYASTSLSVKSLGGAPVAVESKSSSYPTKGGTPGSFVTKFKGTFPIAPLKVGAEIQNPAKKELVDFAQAAKEAGIEPIHDEKGNIISITLPEGYISEEEHKQTVTQIEAMKNGDLKILQELLPLSSTFAHIDKETDSFKSRLPPSTLAALEQTSEEINTLIEEIRNAPSLVKLDELKQKIESFEELTKRAKVEALKSRAPDAQKPTTPASFTSGALIVVSRPQGNEQYRVLSVKDGKVTVMSTEHREKGEETFPEEELGKLIRAENRTESNEKFSYLPIKDFFAMFNKKTNYSLGGILAWKRKWLDSGEVDKFRERNGNITISPEMIDDAKQAIALYVEVLQTEGVTQELFDSAISNLALNVRVLTGIHDPNENDIEYTVKNNVLNGASLEVVRAALEKIKQGKNPNGERQQKEETFREPAPLTPADIYSSWDMEGLEIKSRIDAAIKIFEEYKKFMLEVERARSTGLFVGLVRQKKEVQAALNAGDRQFAFTLVERFRTMLGEKKEEWKRHLALEERMAEVPKQKENILKDFENKQQEFTEARDWVKALRESRVATAETVEFFERLIQDAKIIESRLSKNVKSDDAFNESLLKNFSAQLARLRTEIETANNKLNIIHSSGPGTPVLRPIIVNRKNASHPIRLARRGADGSTRESNRDSALGAFKKDEDARLANEASKKTHDIESDRRETENKFEEMLHRNKEKFLELYADRRQDPATHTIIYTKNENLRRHPYRDVIERVLFKNNISVEDPLAEELRQDAELKKKKDIRAQAQGSLQREKLVYSPAQEKKHWPQDVRTEKEKLEPKTITLPQNKAVHEVPQTSGLVSQQETGTGSHADFLETPPSADSPESGASKPSEVAQEKEGRLQKALKKVNNLFFTREKYITPQGTPTWKVYATAVALSTGAAAYYMKAPTASTPTISAAQPKDYLAEDPRFTWKKYFSEGKTDPELADDLSRLASLSYSKEEFMKKHASLYFKNSGSTSAALGLMGNILRNGPERGASDPYSHLPDPTRLELNRLWEALSSASMATSAEKLKASTFGEALTEVAQKIARKQNS